MKPFISWLAQTYPEVEGFDTLTANHLRAFRAYQQGREKRNGGKLAAQSHVANHKAIRSFLNWGRDNNPDVLFDPTMFRLKKPRTPDKEATVYDIAQLKRILEVCGNDTERMVVRLAVGAGLRLSEIAGLSMTGPDGQSNLMTDPVEDRYLLRVLWDAGAKGKKTRLVPIPVKLAALIRKYVATNTRGGTLIVSRVRHPMSADGLKSLMRRLEKRVGFRVHAHAFRHTYATVSTQQDVNLDKLRVSMGHADYDSLLTYVRLAATRNLGPGKEWNEYLYVPSHRL